MRKPQSIATRHELTVPSSLQTTRVHSKISTTDQALELNTTTTKRNNFGARRQLDPV
jgi:hypothetical protein